MKFVIQKVSQASVSVEGNCVGKIQKGFLVFVGIGKEDTKEIADQYIKKMVQLRIFQDENGKTNLSLTDVGGEVLIISQFTLYANCRKGNRPSFLMPESLKWQKNYINILSKKTKETISVVESGEFGAMMQVSLVNEGPFTIVFDENTFR